MDVDIVVRNGTIVTEAARFQADIGIRGERIVQLGGELTGNREIDASGRLVLPGAIDAHVHLTSPETDPDEVQWSELILRAVPRPRSPAV